MTTNERETETEKCLNMLVGLPEKNFSPCVGFTDPSILRAQPTNNPFILREQTYKPKRLFKRRKN